MLKIGSSYMYQVASMMGQLTRLDRILDILIRLITQSPLIKETQRMKSIGQNKP